MQDSRPVSLQAELLFLNLRKCWLALHLLAYRDMKVLPLHVSSVIECRAGPALSSLKQGKRDGKCDCCISTDKKQSSDFRNGSLGLWYHPAVKSRSVVLVVTFHYGSCLEKRHKTKSRLLRGVSVPFGNILPTIVAQK